MILIQRTHRQYRPRACLWMMPPTISASRPVEKSTIMDMPVNQRARLVHMARCTSWSASSPRSCRDSCSNAGAAALGSRAFSICTPCGRSGDMCVHGKACRLHMASRSHMGALLVSTLLASDFESPLIVSVCHDLMQTFDRETSSHHAGWAPAPAARLLTGYQCLRIALYEAASCIVSYAAVQVAC